MWNETELKSHLVKMTRHALYKVSKDFDIACDSRSSKIDLIRAMSKACVQPLQELNTTMSLSALNNDQKDDLARHCHGIQEDFLKTETPKKQKEIVKECEKLYQKLKNNQPDLLEKMAELNFEEMLDMIERVQDE